MTMLDHLLRTPNAFQPGTDNDDHAANNATQHAIATTMAATSLIVAAREKARWRDRRAYETRRPGDHAAAGDCRGYLAIACSSARLARQSSSARWDDVCDTPIAAQAVSSEHQRPPPQYAA